jgi:hypothetical protein
MNKAYVLEYSVYDRNGVMTFRENKGVFASHAKASRVMREDATYKRSIRVNANTEHASNTSTVVKHIYGSDVWQVLAYYVDYESE